MVRVRGWWLGKRVAGKRAGVGSIRQWLPGSAAAAALSRCRALPLLRRGCCCHAAAVGPGSDRAPAGVARVEQLSAAAVSPGRRALWLARAGGRGARKGCPARCAGRPPAQGVGVGVGGWVGGWVGGVGGGPPRREATKSGVRSWSGGGDAGRGQGRGGRWRGKAVGKAWSMRMGRALCRREGARKGAGMHVWGARDAPVAAPAPSCPRPTHGPVGTPCPHHGQLPKCSRRNSPLQQRPAPPGVPRRRRRPPAPQTGRPSRGSPPSRAVKPREGLRELGWSGARLEERAQGAAGGRRQQWAAFWPVRADRLNTALVRETPISTLLQRAASVLCGSARPAQLPGSGWLPPATRTR